MLTSQQFATIQQIDIEILQLKTKFLNEGLYEPLITGRGLNIPTDQLNNCSTTQEVRQLAQMLLQQYQVSDASTGQLIAQLHQFRDTNHLKSRIIGVSIPGHTFSVSLCKTPPSGKPMKIGVINHGDQTGNQDLNNKIVNLVAALMVLNDNEFVAENIAVRHYQYLGNCGYIRNEYRLMSEQVETEWHDGQDFVNRFEAQIEHDYEKYINKGYDKAVCLVVYRNLLTKSTNSDTQALVTKLFSYRDQINRLEEEKRKLLGQNAPVELVKPAENETINALKEVMDENYAATHSPYFKGYLSVLSPDNERRLILVYQAASGTLLPWFGGIGYELDAAQGNPERIYLRTCGKLTEPQWERLKYTPLNLESALVNPGNTIFFSDLRKLQNTQEAASYQGGPLFFNHYNLPATNLVLDLEQVPEKELLIPTTMTVPQHVPPPSSIITPVVFPTIQPNNPLTRPLLSEIAVDVIIYTLYSLKPDISMLNEKLRLRGFNEEIPLTASPEQVRKRITDIQHNYPALQAALLSREQSEQKQAEEQQRWRRHLEAESNRRKAQEAVEEKQLATAIQLSLQEHNSNSGRSGDQAASAATEQVRGFTKGEYIEYLECLRCLISRSLTIPPEKKQPWLQLMRKHGIKGNLISSIDVNHRALLERSLGANAEQLSILYQCAEQFRIGLNFLDHMTGAFWELKNKGIVDHSRPSTPTRL